MKKEKLKMGVIGVGHMGNYHMTVLSSLNSTHELSGIYDVSQERAKEISAQYDTKVFSDVDELLQQCDAVTIAVPTKYHYEFAKKALQNDCHVLIEKPITETVQQAIDLIELAHQKNKILQVGHVERFNGAVMELKKISPHPLLIEAKRLSPFSTRIQDVGVILDMMIHDLDIVLNLVQSPIKSFYATGNKVLSEHEDIAVLTLEFENNCIATLTASRVSHSKRRTLEITQKDSFVFLDYSSQDIEIHRNASSATLTTKEAIRYTQESFLERLFVHKDNPLKSEHVHFYECIREGKTPHVSNEKDIETLKIALDSIQQIEKKSQKAQ